MLLGTRNLDGSEATEHGTSCDDPHLLGQVHNGTLAGLRTVQPTLYHQTTDACTDQASLIPKLPQMM